MLSVFRAGIQRIEAGNIKMLKKTQSLELQLAHASLAVAERRYTDALSSLTESDEQFASAAAERDPDRFESVLRIRADAFFGLANWTEAASRYLRIEALNPARLSVKSRRADCYWASGNTTSAFTIYAELAKAYRASGDSLLLQEKIEPALEYFQVSTTLISRLLRVDSRPDLASAWAWSRQRTGDGLLLLGDPSAAVTIYDSSIEMWNRLIANAPGPMFLNALGLDLMHRGDANLVLRRYDQATKDFLAAANIFTQLLNSNRSEYQPAFARTVKHHADVFAINHHLDSALSHYNRSIELFSNAASGGSDLPVSLNNRAAVLRLQGELDASLADYTRAIDLVRTSRNDLYSKSNSFPQPEIMLELIIGCGKTRDIDVTVRTRPTLRPHSADLAVLFSIASRNRGFVRSEKNDESGALEDFKLAAETLEKAVEQEGRFDLSNEYAKSLHPLAWLLATAADKSLVNPSESRNIALKACELTDWKVHGPLDSLAAASAALGQFDEAVSWQRRAITVAPPKFHPAMKQRLHQYEANL
jgi:tetratricopeptide (TPR) repeat protein